MNPDVLLQPGKMIPHFSLCSTNGTTVRISDFRGRKSLLLIFTAGKALDLIRELAGREAELNDEDTVVLLIEPSDMVSQFARSEPSGTFRILLDPDAHVSRRFDAEHQPAVYITDQYGDIYSAHRISDGSTLPDADEVLASLRHVNAACPE